MSNRIFILVILGYIKCKEVCVIGLQRCHRETESGLDFAQARYYNSIHGRFTSVDPLTASATIRNPQTFNRYTYVLNSPYKFTDPLGLIPVTTGACGNSCPNSGPTVDGSNLRGRDASFDWAVFTDAGVASAHESVHTSQQVQAPSPTPPPPANYYISRDGTIKVVKSENAFSSYYMESNDKPGEFNFLANLEHNDVGLVYFPDQMDFFGRYGTKDAGGVDKNTGETVGKGDHYLRPEVAAALFGVAAVLKDTHGITIEFGDMSSSNGSDPWQKGFEHHKGHGHKGNRSGMDVDFRYINDKGVSFQSNTAVSDRQFSIKNNQAVYDTAARFGFNKNYQGVGGKIVGVSTAAKHLDHGHLGFGR